MEAHNVDASEDNGLDGAEVREVNGTFMLIHTVEPSDSLSRLSIMYNVDVRTIKNSNSLVSDQIHHKSTLNIPMVESFKYGPHIKKAKKDENEAVREETNRRAHILMMVE
jgi:LysM repeat protein